MKCSHVVTILFLVFTPVFSAQDTISSNPVWIPLNSTPRDTGTFVATQSVNALALHDGKLFAGGSFKKIGPLTDGGVVQLENGSWKKIVDIGKYGIVNALALDTSHNLLFGGDIDTSSVFRAFNIALWDGHNVLNLKNGVHDPVRTIAVDQKNNYYVGGDAYVYGGYVNSYYSILIQKWDGTDWSTHYQSSEVHCALEEPCPIEGQGINSIVSVQSHGIFYTGYECYQPYSARYSCPDVFAVDFEGNLYSAGGRYIIISPDRFPGLSKKTWTDTGVILKDTTFSSVSSVTFKALATDKKGNLFFGGKFKLYPNIKGIGVWDGKTLKPLGKGITGTVNSLALDENAGLLYVGGDFDSAGGKYSPMIAAIDLYHTALETGRHIGRTDKRVNLTIANNTITISNAEAQDLLSLYSITGRRLAESNCAQALKMQSLQGQPIIAVVKRSGKTIIARKILVLP